MLLCGSYVTLKRVTFIPHCLQNVALCGIECYSNVAQMLLFLFAGESRPIQSINANFYRTITAVITASSDVDTVQ